MAKPNPESGKLEVVLLSLLRHFSMNSWIYPQLRYWARYVTSCSSLKPNKGSPGPLCGDTVHILGGLHHTKWIVNTSVHKISADCLEECYLCFSLAAWYTSLRDTLAWVHDQLMRFVHVSYQCGTGITPKLALDVSVGRDEMSRRAEAQRISGEESKFLTGARLNVVLVLRIAGITDAHDSPLYRPGSRRPPAVTANPSGYLRGLIFYSFLPPSTLYHS